jgi:hypothetical protein
VSLSPEELQSLGIPKGPTVRIRSAIQAGLWRKFDKTISTTTNMNGGDTMSLSKQLNNEMTNSTAHVENPSWFDSSASNQK